MPVSIENSVALVTAGTSGLGLAVAERLVQAGARVVVNYASNQERADKVVSQLHKVYSERQNGRDPSTRPVCSAIKADITQREQINLLVEKTLTAMGKLDIVVSNAGWTKFADFYDLDQNVDEAVWDRCFAANVKSHLFLLHGTKEHLQNAKGAFIMTSSVAGVKPSGSSIAYSVTKAAQLHLCKSLAMSVAPSIRVNAVSPGFMETNWIAEIPKTKVNEAKEKTLLKTLTDVGDVAEQVMLLVKSGSVTGANFVIDSGFSAVEKATDYKLAINIQASDNPRQQPWKKWYVPGDRFEAMVPVGWLFNGAMNPFNGTEKHHGRVHSVATPSAVAAQQAALRSQSSEIK
ncbi:hypothetical protein NM208_g10339 [Fusarium decemcellulare]|uniref:Uncharacterized protein n=1 Tax=Fusarium decemcellulare TaxID=57161 RepID=A0ACC1RY81_9HYPO|nr:hypothetical protein NM208_g10339 [Fusarium decemcellulare]